MSSTKRLVEMQRWFNEDAPSPAGRIVYGGFARHTGIPPHDMRVLGTYGLVYLLEGEGWFLDAVHRSAALVPGDLIFLFPELPHSYGPPPGGAWRELFIHFQGPAFDCWRGAGILNPERPVHRVTPVENWLPRLEAFVRGAAMPTAATSTGRVCDFLKLLAAVAEAGATASVSHAAPEAAAGWVDRVRDLLDDDLNEGLDLERVARVMGVSQSTLRHRFKAETGESLTQYRTRKRLLAAAELLRTTNLSNRAIARRVGYGDEFQFSRRFRQVMGVTAGEVRRASR